MDERMAKLLYCWTKHNADPTSLYIAGAAGCYSNARVKKMQTSNDTCKAPMANLPNGYFLLAWENMNVQNFSAIQTANFKYSSVLDSCGFSLYTTSYSCVFFLFLCFPFLRSKPALKYFDILQPILTSYNFSKFRYISLS